MSSAYQDRRRAGGPLRNAEYQPASLLCAFRFHDREYTKNPAGQLSAAADISPLCLCHAGGGNGLPSICRKRAGPGNQAPVPAPAFDNLIYVCRSNASQMHFVLLSADRLPALLAAFRPYTTFSCPHKSPHTPTKKRNMRPLQPRRQLHRRADRHSERSGRFDRS